MLSKCSSPEKNNGEWSLKSIPAEEILIIADSLAKSFILIDGHVDLPRRMVMKGDIETKMSENISEETTGNFDHAKAKRGGLDAPFISICVPSRYQESGGAKDFADSLIDLVSRIPQSFPEKFAMAYSPLEIKNNFEKGLISLPLGMENGAPIGEDINNVKYFFERGIRYITLAHSKDNQICDSSYDTTYTWNGMSPFGEQVVAEMNKWGIMVDIANITDSAAFDVLNLTKAPVIASHTSCRKFTPGFKGNVPDTLIKALAANDGVIHINFRSTFLSKESRDKFDSMRLHLANYRMENGLASDDSTYQAYAQLYAIDNDVFENVQKVADHIDHVVDLVGVDHVAFGSGYEDEEHSLPKGLKDVSTYPNLIFELLRRGYTPEDIGKISYKNTFRVWQKVQEVANELQSRD